ncbi:MAG: YeeE/YedE thiosulfate transporter family protein [Desulfovibrionaceae bacterium]|nr:YeeE/YedE thiosulfate transporter family protein [Desulfovibrionaceae bacterium]
MGPKYPKSKAWSPYAAGALAGLLLALSVLVAGSYFGASTTFVRSAGLIEQAFSPGHVDSLEYFAKEVPKIDWQFMFVIGIFLGSLVSSLSSGTFRVQAVPDAWRERFGANPATRAVVAFCGGVIAMFGARLAGGCPSGHGLSGLAQMALSGYVALICFFIGGVFVARILYKGR